MRAWNDTIPIKKCATWAMRFASVAWLSSVALSPVVAQVIPATRSDDELRSNRHGSSQDRQETPPAPSIQVTPQSKQMSVTLNDGRVTLIARGAPMIDVLTELAEANRLNLVCSLPNDHAVTLILNDVSFDVAIGSILASAGATWTINNDVIFVTTLSEDTKFAAYTQDRKIKVFQLDYASAADVDQAIKAMLSPVGNSWPLESSPTDNRRTKEGVVVEDIPTYLSRIDDYVAQLDVAPRQVLIEVNVLEIELADDKRHGVDFQHLLEISDADVALESLGFANPLAAQAFFVSLDGKHLDSVVEALQSTIDTKTLASPRVLALNGQTARIQIGEQLGFRVTTTTQTSTLESVEFLDVGVVLSVTPRITQDDHVLMHIEPEVSSGAVNPDTGLPEEATTELQTDVMLRDGQGMIIGGLIREGDSVIVNKIPWLGDWKYVGKLFQRRRIAKTRSEIVVCLRPRILPIAGERAAQDEFDIMRSEERLFHGPLCRNPREYEPRLPLAYDDSPLTGCGSVYCPSPGITRLPSLADSQITFEIEENLPSPVPNEVTGTDDWSPGFSK